MVNPREILKFAQSGKYALGSFNFSTAEILKAIVLVAQELKSPIIVSTSEGEADFIGMREAVALVRAWKNATKLPIILNLDHGKSIEKIKKAVAAGYDAVHFDGSELPFEENIEQTRQIVDYIHEVERTFEKHILVEGELGYLRGSSSLYKKKIKIRPEDLTKPKQAQEFIKKTRVDSLAVAIGNVHGVSLEGEEELFLERLAQIEKAVGEKVFLVLHGGSGIADEDIRRAISLGIVKININTEMRVAFKGALEIELKKHSEETTPYKILRPSLEAVKRVVETKIKLFGSDNKI